MSQEEVEKRLYALPMLPEIQDENALIDSCSISRLNQYFRFVISMCNRKSTIYHKLDAELYYIILSGTVEDVDIIKGQHLLNFSIDLPPFSVLKSRVISSGIPKEDIHAVAVEIENLHKREVERAFMRLQRYMGALNGLYTLYNVPKEILLILHNKISEMRGVHEKKLRDCTVTKQCIFLKYLLIELRKQIDAISLALMSK